MRNEGGELDLFGRIRSLKAASLERQAQQALVEALEASKRLSVARYEVGIDGYLGVRLAEQANLVMLYKALGGGV